MSRPGAAVCCFCSRVFPVVPRPGACRGVYDEVRGEMGPWRWAFTPTCCLHATWKLRISACIKFYWNTANPTWSYSGQELSTDLLMEKCRWFGLGGDTRSFGMKSTETTVRCCQRLRWSLERSHLLKLVKRSAIGWILQNPKANTN